ncbi:MAG: hypothetical protein CBC16_09590 [Verrucomicrobia bacterium TMED56]|nr:MAG: hypothetical protein CBC16_09590 [Verrucomicrobia bacterium TMED56]
MNIKHILWDWNGTLINDTSLCVKILNNFLTIRSKSSISVNFYRNNFYFPVSGFYKSIGLPHEGKEFNLLSKMFISNYKDLWKQCSLQPHAEKVLRKINDLNLKQSILSAGHQNDVASFVSELGLNKYFYSVNGTNNIQAQGKVGTALKLTSKLNLQPQEILLVGDTLHDSQVGDYIGCPTLLFSKGHNSPSTLATSKRKIIDDLMQLMDFVQH